MNKFMIGGIVLGAAVTVVDRYIYKLPEVLSTVLYVIAIVLLIAGIAKANKTRDESPDFISQGQSFPSGKSGKKKHK